MGRSERPQRSDRQYRNVDLQPNPSDFRSPYRHDRDRILYSPEFRRLASVTQVLSPENQRIVHNRLTHTLEVAQIGKSIAEKILQVDKPSDSLIALAGGLDPDVVEAAALAHDIGHPPFGHITESALDEILTSDKANLDGFDGNAQSFRIVTRLAAHDTSYPGLDLTRATLAAVLKYPWPRKANGVVEKKWGVFPEDQESFSFARFHLPDKWSGSGVQAKGSKTLEAEIMDWADDVAYAIHDMEDFYKANVIPIDRLATDPAERVRFIEHHLSSRENIPQTDADVAERLFHYTAVVVRPYDYSRRTRVDLRRYSSEMISRFVSSPRLVESPGTPTGWEFEIDPSLKAQIRVLKSLLNYYVLNQPSLQSVRHGYVHLIKDLFGILYEIVSDKNRRVKILPSHVNEAVASGDNSNRIVADFIAGMTDIQVISYYRRLTGISFGDSFDVIV